MQAWMRACMRACMRASQRLAEVQRRSGTRRVVGSAKDRARELEKRIGCTSDNRSIKVPSMIWKGSGQGDSTSLRHTCA
jgi:hypothetical protein